MGASHPLLVSARPEDFGQVGATADGIEVKLDWEHAEMLSGERTLSVCCTESQLPPERVVSVHLPPGTTRRYGMAAAEGNTGTIIDFTQTAFGEEIHPEWMTLHSARRFEYRVHLNRLRTLQRITGFSIALENTRDRSALYTPEDLSFLAYLGAHSEPQVDVGLVVDTAHLPAERDTVTVDPDAVDRIVDRLESDLQDRLAKPFRRYIDERVSRADLELPVGDPWRPSLVTLRLVGPEAVTAIHLNDPVSDGVPDPTNSPDQGLSELLRFCREHEIAIVLEPDGNEHEATERALRWIESHLGDGSK